MLRSAAQRRVSKHAGVILLRLAALSLAAGALGAGVAAAATGGLDVAIGNAVFDRMWAQAPASTRNADGLGPLFSARSCASCHAAGGGRTTFRLGRDDPAAHPGLVIRLGDAKGRPDATYGAQLQPKGVAGISGEGAASVAFAAASHGLPPRPEWSVRDWGYGAPDGATRASPRVALSLDGVGILARVPEAAILAREDPDDRDGDGVSGRAHRMATPDGERIGRFGWKATEPTIEAQAASAFALDIGLSTTLRPDPAGDCTAAEAACRAGPHGAAPGEPEVAPQLMASLVAFLRARPAPEPAKSGGQGRRLFAAAGCAACHAPELPLDGGGTAAAYTDLLLHDMGAGLDDGMGEGAARSREWRTAPLWGVSAALAQGSGLLHDGRAADVSAALAWHDGEAAGARARFDALSANDRNALINFVNGL
ncbi:di-heme oxidoredictase family protein [Hansschlegelia sp. KR7-227]|uniref:di-heme oxidoredictase family protein n=1 Tax=Hansschlegelia sp. KR7-227 TaxID=3400914 RepID=UPI003BFC1537